LSVIAGDEFLDILGNAAETKGRLDSCTNTEVYPTAVTSALKSLIEEVVFCMDGVSRIFRNDPEAKRTEAIDGLRPRVIEGLRVLDGCRTWDRRRENAILARFQKRESFGWAVYPNRGAYKHRESAFSQANNPLAVFLVM
jgi:hypothetical protein